MSQSLSLSKLDLQEQKDYFLTETVGGGEWRELRK